MRSNRPTTFTMLGILGLLVSTCVLPAAAQEPPVLTATEAADHIDETATVCGTVASATYAARSRGRPTFLNFDRPYPNHIFTVVIWGSDRAKFSPAPEQQYRDRPACVTGRIEMYRGKPQIVVTEPRQIRLAENER